MRSANIEVHVASRVQCFASVFGSRSSFHFIAVMAQALHKYGQNVRVARAPQEHSTESKAWGFWALGKLIVSHAWELGP